MFDYHTHSLVSHDSNALPTDMVRAAEKAGLREICFCDHYDFIHEKGQLMEGFLFTAENYQKAYENVSSKTVKIRQGIELGLTTTNIESTAEVAKMLPFDFIIGSVHIVASGDPYKGEYWKNRTPREALEEYFAYMVDCVKQNDCFDVLGHLTYIGKCPPNPDKSPIKLIDWIDYTDEVMKTLIAKNKGMEVNTSGMNSIGEFLPSRDYLVRFRELGGEIVTIGSDAHSPERVGEHTAVACEMVKEIFGHACTFENRRPTFHKL